MEITPQPSLSDFMQWMDKQLESEMESMGDTTDRSTLATHAQRLENLRTVASMLIEYQIAISDLNKHFSE